MSAPVDLPVIAFAGDRRIARGVLIEALWAIRRAALDGHVPLVIDATTGRTVDVDVRGSLQEAQARLTPAPRPDKRPRGRPKLGAAAREISLLPRHWDWLSAQPGGASVALRKLVEAKMKGPEGPERARKAKEATYRLLTTIAGDRPGYEEATRMLFAGDWTAFDAAMEGWPKDVRAAAREMAEGAWRNGEGA